MKNVGSWRIVDNDDFLQITAESTEVLDVVSSVEDARFAEQARPEDVPFVQEIGDRIRVLRKDRAIE